MVSVISKFCALDVKGGLREGQLTELVGPSSSGKTQSEFIAECFMRRTYISGFTDSAGTAVVTKDKQLLGLVGAISFRPRSSLPLDGFLCELATMESLRLLNGLMMSWLLVAELALMVSSY